MERPIYLDYAATTPVDPRVVSVMQRYFDMASVFGNPSSNTHVYGWQAEEAVETARRQVAELIGAERREIIWTSGATEANNLAIIGAARFYQKRGRHIITVKTEHKAVLDPCRYLESEGFEVTYLTPQRNGLVAFDDWQAALREDTILVSVMHVNNEIGVVHDIIRIGELVHAKGALLHVDAAQSAGKVAIDVRTWPVDFLSLSGHKMYGPKGVGALYLRAKPRARVQPLFYGGGQENKIRPGTIATHQVVGMGEAFRLAKQDFADNDRILALRQRFWQALQAMGGVTLNGDSEQRTPGNLNVCFDGVDGEALLMALPQLAISAGSACNSTTVEASHVLSALGLSNDEAHRSLRFSIGRFTTAEDIDTAIEHMRSGLGGLRAASPLWPS